MTNMTVFPLLVVDYIMPVIAVLFIICCVVLILIILVQKGKGGGLSGAFGGGMAGGILGSKTGDFLTWVTIVLVGIFLTLAVVMGKYYKPAVSEFGGAPPARQEQPTSPAEPLPSVGVEDTTSDVNAGAEVNSPDG
jgi:preprotein translocase subunit SecG